MLGRRIARGKVPHNSSHQSDSSTHPERSSPSIVQHDVRDQRRREARSCANASKDPAISDAALLTGNPGSNEAVRRGVNHGLASSENETDCNKGDENTAYLRRYSGGKRGKNAPPNHTEREDTSRSNAVGQPATQGLEQRISP